MPHHFEPVAGRKNRRSLVVDVLEDRHLLSVLAVVVGPVAAVVQAWTADSEDGSASNQGNARRGTQTATSAPEDSSIEDGRSADSALADPGTSPTAVDDDPASVAPANGAGSAGLASPVNISAAKGSAIDPVPVVGSPFGGPGGEPTLAAPSDEETVDEVAPAASPAPGADLSVAKGAAIAVTATDRQTLIGPAVPSTRSVEFVGGPIVRTGPSPREWRPSTSELARRDEAMDLASTLAAEARPADLLASFSPFDRATLERSIDQLLDRFGELEAGLPHWSATAGLASQLLASAMVIGAAAVVRRRLRATEEDDTVSAERDQSASPFGLPGLAHVWAWEEL